MSQERNRTIADQTNSYLAKLISISADDGDANIVYDESEK